MDLKRIVQPAYAVVLPLALASCLQSEAVDSGAEKLPPNTLDLRVHLDKPEYGYQISSEAFTVPAGTEKTVCSVVKFQPKADEKLIWINRFESLTSDFTHHMNVHIGTFSFLDAYLAEGTAENVIGKDLGTYDCDDLGDIMEEQGAVPVYPSQITHQIAELPSGVAVPGLVPLVVVMEHHYINTSDLDVIINAFVNFETTPESEVEHVLTGFFGIADGIDIPPLSQKIQSWTCKIDSDVNMVGISSHSHERGDCFTMNKFDQATSEVVEKPFFVNKNWETPPLVFFDHGEWQLQKGDGVQWACHWKNREDRHVGNGLSASDEMCIFVAVGYPNKLSVEDIKAIVDDPLSANLDQLQEEGLIACEEVVMASPFPITGEPLPEPENTCGDYDQTAARMQLDTPLEFEIP